jgi:hypothetical protein
MSKKAVWSEATAASVARVHTRTSPDRGLGHVSAFRGPRQLCYDGEEFVCDIII